MGTSSGIGISYAGNIELSEVVNKCSDVINGKSNETLYCY